ncbi:HCLS1-associated protein X-1 [Cololabis saira]|uniref:HCLS1-associated protein X-1 n=1 Tax=Cololabis saira TaxID=129043 RepID=UPI002AD367F2|nr:HCLS1-associated protein X-1 [Cololabis saira]
MSVFDLFRGFFGVPGGRRDPFFDAMTHDEDDDDEDEEDGVYYDGFRGEQDPFDGAWRFGFSFGPDGMRFQEPPVFGHILKEMEEIFSQLGTWDGQPDSGNFGIGPGIPRIMPPPPSHDGEDRGAGGGNLLRDFMLRSPDRNTPRPYKELPSDTQPSYERPEVPHTPFRGWTPCFRGAQKTPEEGVKEDRDLDSAVSSGGLDQILTPHTGSPPNQPRIRSFFQSVTVTKVVKPDGTVEERRTVRDGQGNEETTVTRSGGPGVLEGTERTEPVVPGRPHHFSDLRDADSLFSKLFGGFK